MSSNPDSQLKKTFYSVLARLSFAFTCFHLQMSAVRETRRPFIPHGPPSGSCLMQWFFVVETIFTSETQNGFINSIRGWHFPHPHAGPENRCDEEYCSPHLTLSLSLCWQHIHICTSKYRFYPFFGHAPLGHHTLSSDSVQPLSDKPIL